MQPLRPTGEPVFLLMRGVLLFLLADIFYTGFGSAYAYARFQLPGVLFFLFVSQVLSPITYLANLRFMRKSAMKSMRLGIVGMFLAVLAVGLLEAHWSGVAVLAIIGGAGRGVAFCSRTWLEIKHTASVVRERYLSRMESIGTLLRVVAPLLAAGILAVSGDAFAPLFIGVGVLGVLLTWWGVPVALETEAPGAVMVRQTLARADFWRTAPFYLLDGAGHALRTALFVSGAMAVVGTAAGYGSVEAAASIMAAGLLWWQSLRPRSEPSLSRLRNSLLLLVVAWCALLGALVVPGVLVVFVAAYALGNPLVTMTKGGLTLKGLSASGVTVQDSMAARMLLLTLGRFSSLGLALAISVGIPSLEWRFGALVALALLLIPLEYLFAARISKA